MKAKILQFRKIRRKKFLEHDEKSEIKKSQISNNFGKYKARRTILGVFFGYF